MAARFRLFDLIPGRRAAHQRRQIADPVDEHIRRAVGFLAYRETEHEGELAVPLDESSDSAPAGVADYEAPFTATGTPAVRCFFGSVSDTDKARDRGAPFTEGVAPIPAGSLGTQQRVAVPSASRFASLVLGNHLYVRSFRIWQSPLHP